MSSRSELILNKSSSIVSSKSELILNRSSSIVSSKLKLILNRSNSILTISRTRSCEVDCENEEDESNPNWVHFECKFNIYNLIYKNKLRNQVDKFYLSDIDHKFIGG